MIPSRKSVMNTRTLKEEARCASSFKVRLRLWVLTELPVLPLTLGKSGQFISHPHPYRMRLEYKGLSHGLKITRQLSIFEPVCALVPPFRVPPARRAKQIRGIPGWVSLLFVWYTGRDSNPQPSEPESDALSIEPPVRLLYSPVIIAGFLLFVKR